MLRRTFWCLRVLPQVSRRLLWRLRVLPQVSRRLPWRLRESRKCFGELVGRYNMLSMTFSMNKGISFFRRTHVCLPSAEAFCCRPNYAAYPGHCAKRIECLFEAAQSSAEAGEVCLVHDEVEFHLVHEGGILPRIRPNFAGGHGHPDRCEKSPPYLRAHDF